MSGAVRLNDPHRRAFSGLYLIQGVTHGPRSRHFRAQLADHHDDRQRQRLRARGRGCRQRPLRHDVPRIQQEVSALGGTPNDDGSLKGDLHRRWLDLRNAIGGGDQAVIAEVERGEDYIKGKYDEALEDSELSEQAKAAIREAYRSVRAGHDRARDLKHSMAGTEA
jgi:uncharacterized protein (TIGR02284 family)